MSMVTSGILFAINTTGGGKSKLAFAAVAAGVFILGKKLNEARLNAEKFADSWTRLDAEQKKVVISMERATKGLIDTGAEILSVHKITEAGMKADSKTMNAIAMVAIDRAKKMGEGAAGATDRVVKLTDAITKGQTRALKEYGIELDATESLVDAQKEGMEKIIIRSKGLTAEVQTLTEQTYALNNNWETFLGLSVGRVGTIGVLGDLNTEISTLNESMMSADDGFAEATTSMDFFGASMASTILEMHNMAWAADKLDIHMGRLIETQSKIKKIKTQGEEYRGQLAYIGTLGPEQAKVMLDAVAGGMDMGDVIGASQEVEKAAQRKAITGEGLPVAKAGGGGGKGKAAAPTGAAAFSAAEMQSAKATWEFNEAMTVSTELITERDNKLKEVALTNEQQWAIDLEADEQAKLLSADHHQWLLANSEEYRAQELLNQEAFHRAEQQKLQQHIDMKMSKAMYGMNLISSMSKNMSSLMQTENKKQFEIGKKFAYASAVMDTAMGAASAIAGGIKTFGIPWGLIAGLAAAATVTVAGGVQIATIKKQKFGTGGGGVSAGPVGSGGGGYLGGGGNFAAGGGGGAQPTYVTVILGEEEFHGWSIAANDKASQKGDPAFASEAA